MVEARDKVRVGGGALFSDKGGCGVNALQRLLETPLRGVIGGGDEILRSGLCVDVGVSKGAEARKNLFFRNLGDQRLHTLQIDDHAVFAEISSATAGVAAGNSLKNCPSVFSDIRATRIRSSPLSISSIMSARP